jgi:hypothetical protein
MMEKIVCCHCGVELEHYCEICPHCEAPWVGWIDSVGGIHEGGCGTMPDGTFCGECCNEDCNECAVWQKKQATQRQYGIWHCEECGHELEIWLDQVEEEHPAEGDGFRYERRHLMWHCTECGCDYENYWETQWGDTGESKPQRKYWG